MQEQTRFQKGELTLTDRRLIVGLTAYPLPAIHAVRVRQTYSARGTGIVLFLMGLLLFWSLAQTREPAGLCTAWAGLLIITGLIWSFLGSGERWVVQFQTRSRWITALRSPDRQECESLAAAILQSIADYGAVS